MRISAFKIVTALTVAAVAAPAVVGVNATSPHGGSAGHDHGASVLQSFVLPGHEPSLPHQGITRLAGESERDGEEGHGKQPRAQFSSLEKEGGAEGATLQPRFA